MDGRGIFLLIFTPQQRLECDFCSKLGIYMRIFASCQCIDYAHVIYAGAGEARMARVMFAVGCL